MDFTTVKQNLEAQKFTVHVFASGEEAAAYLNEVIDGKTVGFGGSMTLDALGLYDSLGAHNTISWHWKQSAGGACQQAMSSEIYLTSANALAETGELINIDGTGNRVAATLYGHKKIYFVIGRNKLAPTYDEALWRARNIAAPKNARRLGKNTPCAVNADRCFDCRSPERICRGLVVLWEPMNGTDVEVLLVDEDLGL